MDPYSMHSGSISFQRILQFDGVVLVSMHSQRGVSKHDIRSPQCVTRKACYESHRTMR